MKTIHSSATSTAPDASHVEDIKLAASKMARIDRRAFQAEMAVKYCAGNARQAEDVFGWSRAAVQLGLHERRTGVVCLSAQATFGGDRPWEEKHPQVAEALWSLAQSYSQQDPSFRGPLLYTRLTAAEALRQLRAQGFADAVLPSPSTMAEVLNRNGYRLRPVLKAKPQKKIPQTDAIFANIKAKDAGGKDPAVVRVSIDCKATVNIGEYARGGKTRGDNQAADHDMGCEEKHTPFGIVDEDSGDLHLTFGSSAKTSDFIVDALQGWWEQRPATPCAGVSRLQIKVDNGPESSGRRTQFLHRMVQFADTIGLPIQLLYYPPYHSKYNPIERCWGILEQHWNGTRLTDVETMLAWAKTMTWKGLNPVVELSRTVYEKGVTLTKAAMREVEARLRRNPQLPKWDILILPAQTV
jgi:hypothetical protein